YEAAKYGVGEVAWPIISSTATTLGAFLPLAFWPGIMGEFMKYLPITLIIVLGSSLFVALIINPVLTALYMKVGETKTNIRKLTTSTSIFMLIGVFFLFAGVIWLGNILILIGLFGLANQFILKPSTKAFQNKFLPFLERNYEKFLA